MINEFRKSRRYERPTLFRGRHEFISIFFLHLFQFRVKRVTRDLSIMLLIIREFFAHRNKERRYFPDGVVTEIKFTRVPWNHRQSESTECRDKFRILRH